MTMTKYVITFNRDKTPSEWQIVGPFDSKEAAGAYAKFVYRTTKMAWVVHPINAPA